MRDVDERMLEHLVEEFKKVVQSESFEPYVGELVRNPVRNVRAMPVAELVEFFRAKVLRPQSIPISQAVQRLTPMLRNIKEELEQFARRQPN